MRIESGLENLKICEFMSNDIFEREALRIFEQNAQKIHLLIRADMRESLFSWVTAKLPWKYLGINLG